jgi:hypothetical protein
MREAIIDANVALGEPDHLMREAISMQSVSPGWTRALRKIT